MYSYKISYFYMNIYFMFILVRIILKNKDCTYLYMICMIRLKINNGLYWNNIYIGIMLHLSYVYLCIRFKILLAAFCKAHCFSNDILSLYDSCMTFVYYFMPYISSIYHRHIEHFFTFLAGNTVFSLVSESPR